LDASAWVKRYLDEPGTQSVLSLFGEPLASTILGYVEVASTLARQQAARKLSAGALQYLQQKLRTDWKQFIEVPMTAAFIGQAVELAEHYKLRGADTIHLAAALSLQNIFAETNDPITLVSSDIELLQAVQAAGLLIRDPVPSL
jgi:predicted nucleic acid-binding protein